MANQFSRILDSNVMKKRVQEELGLDSFQGETNVSVQPQTNLMRLQVTADTALMAYLEIKSIMKNYNSVSDYVIQNVVMELIEEPVIPTEPSNPLKVRQLMVLSFLISTVVFLIIFGAFSYLKDTVKNPEDVHKKVDAKMLGVIWHERKKRRSGRNRNGKEVPMMIQNPLLSSRFVEANRMAASKVRSYMDKREAKTLLVTSVLENEGKSTVAANLALALAQEGKQVLLMDCDFRRPAQYKIFDLPEEEQANLPEILRSRSGMDKLIQKRKDIPLYMIFNNTPCNSVDEFMQNGMLRKIVDFLKENMDYVIIDSSPMALVADAEELAHFMDASLLVIRQDVVLAKDINDAVDALNKTEGKVLGCIFNDAVTGFTDRKGRYGGYYGKRA